MAPRNSDSDPDRSKSTLQVDDSQKKSRSKSTKKTKNSSGSDSDKQKLSEKREKSQKLSKSKPKVSLKEQTIVFDEESGKQLEIVKGKRPKQPARPQTTGTAKRGLTAAVRTASEANRQRPGTSPVTIGDTKRRKRKGHSETRHSPIRKARKEVLEVSYAHLPWEARFGENPDKAQKKTL